MSITQLRYPELSAATRARWNSLLKSNREITARAKRLIQLAVEACEAVGPIALQARLHGGALWICCPQIQLAALLDCSDRTVRDELARLTACGALQTHAHPTKDNIIGYRIDLAALESIPESHTPDLDDIILDFADQQTASGVTSGVTSGPTSGVASGPTSGPTSGVASGPTSGPTSGVASGVASALMIHEGMNELYKTSSITHDHESHETREAVPKVRFDQISENHIRAIAGFTVESNGRTGILSEPKRLAKVHEYFTDAVQAGLALPAEFRTFAALFRNVGRRTDIKHRSKYLRTLWRNRNDKPLDGVLTAADRQYARQLAEIDHE